LQTSRVWSISFAIAGGFEFFFNAARAELSKSELSKKKDHPNDARISDNRRGRSDGWNASRFGLYVCAMVQHLSLPNDGGRPAPRLHEPVRRVLSSDRNQTARARDSPQRRLSCRSQADHADAGFTRVPE
jgi:hypothetical protein